MRLGAIDLGSNTVRLLVAQVDAVRGLSPLHAEQRVTRLGEGLARSRRLAPAALERTLATVRAYRDRARALGAERIILVATAAVREAANRADLLEPLAAEGGLEVRVASGTEEARLTLLGVAAGLPAAEDAMSVMDIGGGSTELIAAAGHRPVASVSLPLGVVRLAESYFRADPLDPTEYDACAAHVRVALAEAWPVIRPAAPRRLVGTAGTVTTLAALDLGLTAYESARVHGHQLSRTAVERVRDRVGSLTAAERARLPCVEPGRADLLVPGIAIALGVLDGLGLSELTVSDMGLREGILLDAVGWRRCLGA